MTSQWEENKEMKGRSEQLLPKFRKDLDFPFTFVHNGLHLFCYILKNFPCLTFSKLPESLDFPDLVKIIEFHVGGLGNADANLQEQQSD